MKTYDMRGIWLIDGEHVSNTKELCTHCGRSDMCSVVRSGVKKCILFVPQLAFRSFAGTERYFNTFRIGKVWTQRVREGSLVALYDARNKVIDGHAEVMSIESGEKGIMEKKHGSLNHTMLGKRYANDGEMLETFRRIRIRNAGPMIYNGSAYATVLYLRRLQKTGGVL